MNVIDISIIYKSLYILDRKFSIIKGSADYNSCQLQKDQIINENFIINCPDNALHFVSASSATENFTIAQYDFQELSLPDFWKHAVLLFPAKYANTSVESSRRKHREHPGF